MKFLLKTILFFIFGAGLSFAVALPVFAQNPPSLEVQFQNDPLFNEANFLPGESVTRWVKVTNNSGQTQPIAVEAINVNDPDGLGDVLDLQIKEGSNLLYNGTLSDFFNHGEFYLSDLANGSQTQYDFSVAFNSTADNSFQGKSLGFDILIGFQGTEGEENNGGEGGEGGGGSSGGGTNLPSGLTISEETVKVLSVSETTAVIYWETSYAATSQVIFSAEGQSHIFDLSAVHYGYAQAWPDPEDLNKVLNHTVTLTGLTPGTTYYFRCVSHASPATITREHNFTTLAQSVSGQGGSEGGGQEEGQESDRGQFNKGKTGEEESSGETGGQEGSKEIFGGVNVGENIGGAYFNTEGGQGGESSPSHGISEQGPQASESFSQGESKGLLSRLLASIGGLFSGKFWLHLLILLIIALLILIFLNRRRKREEKRQI